ncbi:hypothetical protein EIP86_000961, partial [Pleurotus ostreatoroseus]
KRPGHDNNCLTKADDPSGEARKLKTRWIVSQKLVFGALSATGQLQAASAGSFKRGDFVDVKIVPEIFNPRSATTRDVKVSFKMTRIVKLQARSTAQPAKTQSMPEGPLPSAPQQDEWDRELEGSVKDIPMVQG